MKKPHRDQQNKKASINIDGDLKDSTIIAGNNNTIINSNKDEDEILSRRSSEVDHLLNKRKIELAKSKIEEIQKINPNFSELKYIQEKLNRLVKKREFQNKILAFVTVLVITTSLMWANNERKEILCEENSLYNIRGITAITAQTTSEGRIYWVGHSDEGITTYNENLREINTYSTKELNTSSSSIITLEFDEIRNGMWVSIAGNGVVFVDGLNKITRYTKRDGLPSCWITDITITKNAVYFSAFDGTGLGQFTDKDGFDIYPSPENFEDNSTISLNFNIYSIEKDFDESIWVGTINGLYQLNGTTWKGAYIPPSFTGNFLTMNVLAIDGESTKWIGTSNGLFLLKGEIWSESIGIDQGLPSNKITSLASIGKNYALVGTDKGLSLCQKGDNFQVICNSKSILFSDEIKDRVNTVTILPDGKSAYIGTVSRIPIKVEYKINQ